MRVDLNIQGVDGVLGVLQSLPAEVVSKRGGPVKLSLAKGARFLRDRAKENLNHQIAGDGSDSTGTTVKAVIASRGKAPVGSKGERYLVRVKRVAFVNAKGARTSARRAAQLMEYGSALQPARPWLRPAVQQHGAKVIDLVTQDLLKRLDVITRKLAAQNGASP
ncbi:hypothetical protein MUG10_00915 [Xanthomonas prunicola]|uniref:hypothetical protein n=1 Tax=Xanthomonas prunicola TaxID=2053930 RepID=UPI0020789DE9|nr:hypothetical protein [Xanthomonas prunicola]USJ00857.1 hypothetical protein MUG10_00915 [Xanthomonas prunicola]